MIWKGNMGSVGSVGGVGGVGGVRSVGSVHWNYSFRVYEVIGLWDFLH
ncbi:MAG: hypothetical protein F6K40_08740 [Okeania sp. SIO3I5]|nr:hypothetical protein [Okeania sp. SIO3I5]NEQ36359.1 hypothetical protein [Okeania sp. SIO3I5]